MSDDGNVISLHTPDEIVEPPCDVEPPCETVGISKPEPKTHSPAAKTLLRAAHLIDGDRARIHGDRHVNFGSIAQAWGWWLNMELTAADVCVMMSLLKMARIKGGEINKDDFIDGAGYIGLASEMVESK